ncbi:hypothetical protein PGT21_018378 [Puccinia graminis f. sp. tritici]|uniref:Uncharacterized protein n=1 Tax=Puccinia graminis f. sp. tritici TaxID=56615 RepID=A0A5B0NDD0_PUCGR|nr:hypothetical protein PGT21_018378 [Puccinia graminis f. sp. tritici]KAA1136165.1 hypothetical protein PGTUg99_033960 [Puccinia graminis f. sp. tritici]
MENPNDAKLVRDLGKLYLRFNEPDQNDTRQGNVSRRIGNSRASPRSEPSLKLAIHYLEQSIQIDTRDPLTWLFLGRAWSLLLVYPTENENEREQRLSNSSLAFRKAIHISSNLTGSNLQNIRQTNRFRLAYAEHLEGLNKYQEAASVLQDALGIDETDVECWWELGRMMELWALDQEAQSPTTKLERVERMRRACEAFKKATELEPEDMILRQGNLDGEKALVKLTTELQAEEEFRAKSLKAEEEIRLAADRMRGLNLSPVGTNKATELMPVKSQPPTTNLSSVSALKKLVSDLREIPEFGQKARPPRPVVEDNKQSIEEPVVKTEDQICTTQVESVISSSPAPSSGANHTRVPTGEIDGSSLTRNTPLPRVIQENLEAPEPSQLLPPISKTLQPKNPARYLNQTGSTSVDSSPQEDLSPPSTQSQDDAKMMLMNLRTGSIEPPLELLDHQDEQPSMTQVITNQSHDSQLYSYQPPSPSALPTSMMQSLSARLGTPKAHLISSPKSSVSSNSRSCSNGSQKAREWHQRKMNSQHDPVEPGLIANQQPSTTSHSPAPPSQSPAHDRPRSLKAQLTEIIRSSPVNFRDTDSNHQSQQAPSISASSETHHSPSGGDHSLSCDQPENQLPNGEYHQSEDRSSHSPSSYPHHHHSPHSQTHFHHHQPHVSVLKKPTIGNSNGIFSPLSKELTVDLDPPRSSPPPPDIPPRPASLCIQSTRPPSLPHPHHPSSSILYNKDQQYNSHFIDHNPHHSFPAPPRQNGTMDVNQSINGHHQSVVGSIPQENHHIRRPNSSCLSPQSPVRQSATPRYTHSPTTTSTTKSSNCRLSSHPSLAHQAAFIQGDQSTMACNYALIDAHLQSILEIDLKRKQELKEIKRQIRKTDEWAESRRRTVIEEIRRVCTPVSSGSVSVHPHTPHQSGSSHSRSLSRGQPTEANMSPKPVDKERRNECQTKQNGLDDSPRFKRTPEYPVNLGESVGRRKAVPRTPVVAPVLHPTKRSSSTPPESSHPLHHQHRLGGNQDQMNHKLQAAVYSDPSTTLGNFRQEHVAPNRALHSASVLPSHHHPSPQPQDPYHQQRNSYHPLSPHPSQPNKNSYPLSHNPDGQHQQPIVADQLSTEFDKLGPAGFAINGITSIIQLLHQQHQQQQHQP